MSFTNNVYGGVPQSELVFTTSNVSSDNASFINLSVSDSATITNLTTVNWSQPNLNASTIVTDTLVATNTSAVNLDVSGVMNVSDLNISDLNVSDISVSTLNVGDIVIDEAEVTTLRFDDVTNANYSEIQRDNDTLTIAGGYLNAQGTQYNGDIAFTPYNLSNATPPSMVVQASDGKVYIPNMSSLDINTSNITVTNIVNTDQITATGVGIFKSSIAVMNPISQTQTFFWAGTAFQLGNLASVDFNIGNDGSNPDKGIIVRGGVNSSVEIPILTADNLSSTLANISTLNVSTINIADISVPDINTSQLNASNISVDVDLTVGGTTQTDILEADIISAGCDMTRTLETSTNMYYPNNLLIDYSAPQISTTIELSSNLSLNGVELLPDIVTLADPTLSMLSGTAQITNANISTLTCDLTPNIAAGAGISVTSVAGVATITNTGLVSDPLNLSQLNASNISCDGDITTDTITCDLTPNLTAGAGISITSVGGKPTITNTGIVSDPLNLSQLNASNISCDGDITTDTITCDLTPNLTAGAGVSITSVGNKPVISGVNSVSANVSVSDFIETLQIVPSGTISFPSQGIGQGSQLISVYDYQGGTAYTAANMFTVYAGDKIHFTWKQSGWVQTAPGQTSYVICYIVKGTNPIPQTGDRIEVGRIHQYIYGNGDHEEISGSFVYNVTSTFSFYRSQMEGAPNLVTQAQDYGAATATVYRATIPNSISVPTLINATNISVDNLSVLISMTSPLSNVSIINASDMTTHDLHVSGGIMTADDATIVDLTVLGALEHDFSKNFTAGSGISITHVGNQVTIATTGGGGGGGGNVPDPLNISQLNASNISVDGDIELIGTSNISANATTATVFTVVAENVSVSNDILCSNLTRSYALESVANTSVGFDLSVGNDATITRDLKVQRYLDAGKPTFILLRRSNNTNITGAGQPAVFNQNTTGQMNGEFGTSGGTSVVVTTGGWYRVSWAFGYKRISNTGGDRIAVRSYNQTYAPGGSWTFDSLKNTISSSCYIRRNNQCREGHITGYNFVYIPAGGAVRIIQECMVEGASNWTSLFNGMQFRGSSNFMVEFVSSAAET
jgi:hypothetical protein